MTPAQEIIRAALFVFGAWLAIMLFIGIYCLIWKIQEWREAKRDRNLPNYMRAYDKKGNRIK